jgi:hypothetical protein
MFEMAPNRQGNILSPSPTLSALLGYHITASITLRRHLPSVLKHEGKGVDLYRMS